MNKKLLLRFLKSKDACQDSIDWIENGPCDLKDMWYKCPWWEWMNWVATHAGLSRLANRTRYAVECADRAVFHNGEIFSRESKNFMFGLLIPYEKVEAAILKQMEADSKKKGKNAKSSRRRR